MFERFTETARQVVVLAQQCARLSHADHIGTEHIFIAFTRQPDSVAGKVLAEHGIDEAEAWRRVKAIYGWERFDEPGGPDGQIPFTEHAKKLMELALREALSLGHNYIGTEHLLIAFERAAEQDHAALIEIATGQFWVRDAVLRMISGPGGRRRHVEQNDTPHVATTPVERIGSLTLVTLLQHVRERIERDSARVGKGKAGREFALALTALEDAQMRYVRGRSIEDGRYAEADPDKAGA